MERTFIALCTRGSVLLSAILKFEGEKATFHKVKGIQEQFRQPRNENATSVQSMTTT